MSVQRLTGTITLALSAAFLALLALSVHYAGGVSLAVAAVGTGTLAMLAGAYLIFSREVGRPLDALARASSGAGLLPPGRHLPAEIESIKSYFLSASALLDEYRERHRDILMSVPDVLLALDGGAKITFANRAAFERTGYSEDDLLGRPLTDFVAPGSRERAVEVVSGLLDGRSAGETELELLSGDGCSGFFEFSMAPLWKGGAAAGCLLSGRPIDERRKMISELEAARRQAEEASCRLKRTVADLEEFSLLAVRRELKMQELREMFVRLKEEHEIGRDFPG